MSWTKFKDNHLFSVNLAIVASLILWQIRKDFEWHAVIVAWVASGFFFPRLRLLEKKLMLTLGKINGTILLSAFYFLAFTPFSLVYRWCFRHPSFKKRGTTFETKESISSFDRPF